MDLTTTDTSRRSEWPVFMTVSMPAIFDRAGRWLNEYGNEVFCSTTKAYT